MSFILNPLYNFVSGVIVLIHKALAPIFGTDSGVTWTLSIMGLRSEEHTSELQSH